MQIPFQQKSDVGAIPSSASAARWMLLHAPAQTTAKLQIFNSQHSIEYVPGKYSTEGGLLDIHHTQHRKTQPNSNRTVASIYIKLESTYQDNNTGHPVAIAGPQRNLQGAQTKQSCSPVSWLDSTGHLPAQDRTGTWDQ